MVDSNEKEPDFKRFRNNDYKKSYATKKSTIRKS